MPATAERVEQPWQVTPREQRQCIGVAMLVWFFLIAAAARYGWKNPERHAGRAETAWDCAMAAMFGIPIGLFVLMAFVAFLSIPFFLIFG
jgi:uncharacterized membrane protein YidH (DUF202 family)